MPEYVEPVKGRPPRYEPADSTYFVNVPEDLRKLPQWVCWRVHPREDGKPAKIPIDPKTGHEASVTNETTWSTFEDAVACFDTQRYIRLAGIGFVFTEKDPFTGIDIDDCRNAETGEIVDWALAIIVAMDSYAEVSPSKTGVKIIVRGSVPGVETRRNKIEMYDHSRYFTITGVVVKDPAETGKTYFNVEDRQVKLDGLYKVIFGEFVVHASRGRQAIKDDPTDARKLARVREITDDNLIELAMTSANGPKFSRLWTGDLSDYNGDHSRADMGMCAMLCYWTRCDHERVDRLFRRSGLMREKWDERRGAKNYGERTIQEAVDVAQSLYDPDMGFTPLRNDLGNADIFIQLAGQDFRYVTMWKEWIAWNGKCWLRDAEAELRHAIEKVPQELMKAAKDLIRAGNDEGPRALKWAIQAGEAYRIHSLDDVLRWRLRMDGTLLDQQPWRLATASGVLDLRDATITEGKRGDWLTRGTTVKYEPRAKCARFDKFMSEIMQGDEEMVAYLWRVIGYCLTGDTSERAFFILHGGGKNGKTTFVEVVHALLDRYAQTAKFSTFLRKTHPGNGANDDIAHLAGARVVIASEADEAQALDASTVKTLTGSDTVRARFLYSGEFEFKPTFKLFLVTNHVPRINEGAHALWDRLHYIPFNYRVPPESTDKQLMLTLLGELEGIFARAVESCLEWQRNGLQPPKKVLAGVEELREEMDPLTEAIATLCEQQAGGKLNHGMLYEAYRSWCRENGINYPLTSKMVFKSMKSKGYAVVVGHARVRIWQNISLRNGHHTMVSEETEL